MTQEEKQLLLKDLCGRLPYHPPVKIYNDSWEGCKIGEFDNHLYYHHVESFSCDRIEIKPYLRPMSSMTEEEKEEWNSYVAVPDGKSLRRTPYCIKYMDWLLEHHFDFRRLIKKGLAIEAPGGMYNLEVK